MKLTDKYTVEQINSAKKTIIITTEIDGETHKETIDATQGYAVMTNSDERIGLTLNVSREGLMYFAASLLKEIVEAFPAALVPILMDVLGKSEEKENKAEPIIN